MEFQACLELGEGFFLIIFPPTFQEKKGLSPKTDLFLLFFLPIYSSPTGFLGGFVPLHADLPVLPCIF